MTDKPKGPSKPFLSDESELDAWDEMFDALHETSPAEPGAPAEPPPMDWPAPAPIAAEAVTAPEAAPASEPVPEPAAIPVLARPEHSRTLDEFPPSPPRSPSEIELDEQLSLDRAVKTQTDETDFSDLGSTDQPAALGEMLGAAPFDPPSPAHHEIELHDDDEEEVYTSASRPNATTAPPPFAPTVPAAPIAPAPPTQSTPVRRTAAIIRRTPAPGVPTRPSGTMEPPSPATARGFEAQRVPDNAFADEVPTRITDLEEIQARAAAARSKAPTAPPPLAFTGFDAEPVEPEVDEYEIEIGASGDSDAPAPAPAIPEPAAPRRTVANVIRRSVPMQAVAPPRPEPRAASEIKVEVDASESSGIPEPASEDDFSDVAAAVGAMDDEVLDPPARPITARAESLEVVLDEPEYEAEAAPEPEPEPEDDHVATTVAPADILDAASSDAYVPMGARLDEALDLHEEEPAPSSSATLADSPRALEESLGPAATLVRPPALVDLYPRVKTPTSVPPFGQQPGEPSPASTIPGLGTVREHHVAPAAPPRIATAPAEYGEAPELEPSIDLEAIQLPEQVPPLPSSQLDEAAAAALLVYERELASIDESATSAALRVEAGRLCERLGDVERARAHYDAALLADPRATAALRGLRRIARGAADLVEATRQLEAEIAVAGALEKRPLGHYRIDLLLASGEQDLARVAVGEALDHAPSDVRALLAQLELAFLDGRVDEFGAGLEQLARAVGDAELRSAVQAVRGLLAAHQQDGAAAATWFAASAESDPGSLGARLGAIAHAAASGAGEATAHAYLDLAQQLGATDPATSAALAVRAQAWAGGEAAAAAAQHAAAVLPGEPLVARAVAETAAQAGHDLAAAGAAFAAWSAVALHPAERAYAAGRAAELDPARAAELWGTALQLDADDDYAAAQLRTAYVAAEATQLAIEVDLGVARDVERDRARLRAAFGLIAQGQLDGAIDLLARGRAERPGSLALAEALAEAYAAAGRWGDRANLLAELAEHPGEQLDRDVAQLRSALAWEEAAGAAAERGDRDELGHATAAALGAWERVIERGGSPTAHGAAILLATQLGDRDVLAEALARAQGAEHSRWAQASLALRRARLVADDPERADAMLREAIADGDDPRRTLALLLAAARRKDLGDAAAALEDRANQLPAGSGEAAALRLRAAQLALDHGDAARATALLVRVGQALPGLTIISDLLAAARRRAGDRDRSGPIARPGEVPQAQAGDAFASLVRDADLAAAQNDGAAALALYQRALELRPGDPLATVPLVRTAMQIREAAPVAALALAQLRAAEAAGDQAAKAEAYELLARIDRDLRDDAASAQIALESASQADPARVDLMHRLEREYTVTDQLTELLRLRRAELDQIPAELATDRAAMIMDTAALAERDKRSDLELGELYRAALAADPRRRVALLRLEALVRRAGASPELAQLEEQIAAYFEGDPRTQAAFCTRAGETLAELGQIDAAVERFGQAEAVQPGHLPALEGWRQAALKGQLWIDVAAAAERQAAVSEPEVRAALHHFAGVVLMDKALVGDQAMTAFRKALDADPGHKDAFLRLRILLEEDARHDELAILLASRLEHEHDGASRVELHRALARLHRDFLGDRDTAKHHYREILAADANDLRAHAAVADIAWEQGAWQEAADALMARARLENDGAILKTLCFRLGLIYADRLVDVPMALKAFQRALTYQPDDEATLVRLADLATQAGEWKLALGACERLVKNETDPEKRAAHLSRVAKIFRQGFGDVKRAERALNLALDGAPTSDDALTQLVQFYRDSGDMTSVRVHLNRVAGTMRVRLQQDPKDGVAYRVISRAMSARAAAGVAGSLAIARAAAELADLLGAAGEPERVLLAEPARVDLAQLLRPEADEVLFPRGVQPELRQIFQLLGDRVAKHVGVDLRAYGVGRGDRLRAGDGSVAAHAQDVATGLGFGELDVYVSARQPFTMAAEPTSPVSLVIGQAVAQGDPRSVRFAAGAALKLAQVSLAIPARLAPEDLGVLVVALVRLFQPDFPGRGLDEAAVAGQMQKLRRLIPTGLMNELKPFALAVDAGHFDHQQLARDLKIAGLRAGLIAAGSLVAGLAPLAAQAGTDVPSFLADPVAQGLVTFALGEDHATLAP